MKRMVFVVAVLLVIGACVLPTNLIPVSISQPTAAAAGVTQPGIQSNPTETATVLLTDTPISVTATSIPPTASPRPSETETTTASPIPNLTTTLATATDFTAVETSTLAVAGSGTPTTTPHVLTYGTLPPEVPFSQIHLVNRSKRQAYISLQVTTLLDSMTIMEYPVYGHIKVKAPLGYYLYVAWVGGNKMVGEFRLHKDEELTITLYKDRVVVK